MTITDDRVRRALDFASADAFDLEDAQIDALVRDRLYTTGEPVQIGRYLIHGSLGQGGMGRVYLAYDNKLDRDVAIKIVNAAGADGPRRMRLLREAQAIAQVKHPNVITVYEVGEHEHQVFIAMEFIAGLDLARWRAGKGKGADWRTVLRIYCCAGEGLAAAHARKIIHRDFKPHNVVLGDDDIVKVLDFGLARVDADALDHARMQRAASVADEHAEHANSEPASQREPPRTLAPTSTTTLVDRQAEPAPRDTPFTHAGELLGTPRYMAPEQWQGGTVDERTDQFSFCVALWEALYRTPPFRGETRAELERTVAEGLIAAPPAAARVPRWLQRVLLRGLSGKPDARWSSMTELLAALRHGQTRMRRRIALYGAVVVALIAAGTGGWMRYEHARRIATCEAAGAEITDIWNDDARAALRTSLLGTGVPYAQTSYEKMVPWIDQWARAWTTTRTQVCFDAEVDGCVSQEVGRWMSGCLAERRDELRILLEVFGRAEGADVQNAVRAATRLSKPAMCSEPGHIAKEATLPAGWVLRAKVAGVKSELLRVRGLMGAGHHAEGLALAERALEVAASFGYLPTIVEARYLVGRLASMVGDFARAEEILREAYLDAGAIGEDDVAARAATELAYTLGYEDLRNAEGLLWARSAQMFVRRLGQSNSPLDADVMTSLGSIYQAQGEYALAKQWHERSIAILERELGPDHPNVAFTLNNLANTLGLDGEDREALTIFDKSLGILERTLGADHPMLGTILNNMSAIHMNLKDFKAAEALCEHAWVILESALGPADPNAAIGLACRARARNGLGRTSQALTDYERALSIQEGAWGPDHPRLAGSMSNLGVVLRHTGRFVEARALFEHARALDEAALGPDHPDVSTHLNNLCELRIFQGDYGAARALGQRALAIAETGLAEDHPRIAETLCNLAKIDVMERRYNAALARYDRALAIKARAFGSQHHSVGAIQVELGSLNARRGRHGQALPAMERGLALEEEAHPDHPDVADALISLAAVLQGLGRHQEAREKLERALRIDEVAYGPDAPAVAIPLVGLGQSMLALGHVEEAVALLERATQLRSEPEATPEEHNTTRFALARALWGTPIGRGRDRVRARRLAMEAAAGFRVRGAIAAPELAEVDAWSRSHR